MKTPNRKKTDSSPVGCPTLFCDALRYHDQQAACVMKHATETRENIAAMEANPDLRPLFECEWETTKAYNLSQADHDEKWATRHAGWAAEIRLAQEVIAAARELSTALAIVDANPSMASEDDHYALTIAACDLHDALIDLDSQNNQAHPTAARATVDGTKTI